MEELKHKMDLLTDIDEHILTQLSSFAGAVSSFQSTVNQLSSNVGTLTSEVKYLRRDIDDISTMKKEIDIIKLALAQTKGSWIAVCAGAASLLSIGGLIIEIFKH